MANYIVSYDLHNQRNYEPVHALLRSWGGVRLLESVWCLTNSATAVAIRDALLTKMDSDDSVAVLEFKSDAAWAVMRCQAKGVEWLKRVNP